MAGDGPVNPGDTGVSTSMSESKGSRGNYECTAPGFLDTRLRYAAGCRSYAARASIGV